MTKLLTFFLLLLLCNITVHNIFEWYSATPAKRVQTIQFEIYAIIGLQVLIAIGTILIALR